MSSASDEEIEQAIQEHLNAIDELKKIRDKYFPAGQAVSEEMVTDEALAELREAARKVAEKWEKCTELSKRRRLSVNAEGQSS